MTFKTLPSVNNEAKLNPQQSKVLQLVKEGKSVCILGSAGVGKSFLLKQIISDLQDKYVRYDNGFYITSLTGQTATAIKGRTLHSFAGIGDQGDEDFRFLLLKIAKNKVSWNRWKKCQSLIIDEISMLSGELFDKLEAIARAIKGNKKPFGGIQLIISGDFFQLSPVRRRRDRSYSWVFDANSWFECLPPKRTIELTHIYRQTDLKLIKSLQDIRGFNGLLPNDTFFYLSNLEKEPNWPKDNIVPTRIYARNSEVRKFNEIELNKIHSRKVIYKSVKWGKKKNLQFMERSCISPDRLVLKLGAQVMLTKNVFHPKYLLVNGAQGVVVGFKTRITDGFEAPVVRFTDGEEVVIEIAKWEYREWENVGEETKEVVVATKIQIPLTLSWAITVHKSQGQTIERLIVDCNKMWLEGQLYVALSRASDPKYLQVLNFDENKIINCSKVKEFYRKLGAKQSSFELEDIKKKGNDVISLPQLTNN